MVEHEQAGQKRAGYGEEVVIKLSKDLTQRFGRGFGLAQVAASRGEKLRPATMRANRLFSSIRCKIEKVFGWWKRSAGYRRVRYVGPAANRLELEFKSICWNLKRLATLTTT
jgi:IS5 family transposase